MHPVESLLDTDLYKLTMQQFVLHQFPGVHVKYKFCCRTKGIDLSPTITRVQDELCFLNGLRFEEDELEYLKSLSFIKPDYIDFLRIFRLNSNYVDVWDDLNGAVEITVEGPWLYTILYEIYILKIVNELYFTSYELTSHDGAAVGLNRLERKLEKIQGTGIKFADFGTRRAFSREWHEGVIKTIMAFHVAHELDEFVGTSNVLYAMRYGMIPIGTMAHEVFQVCQALTRVQDSQKFALQKWADEYRGNLGIALSDTLGIDKFLRDFDMYFAKLFDGLRHDSGDPKEWFGKVLRHYESFGIDPATKTAVFSDGLTVDRIRDIDGYVDGRMKTSYGIGTNLTNDLGDLKPIQIVIKVVEANGQPVAKLSDSPGKEMCEDEAYVNYLRKVIKK